MIQINKRSIGVCILLSIITFGIYGIYWMYLLVKNTRSIQKDTASCTGEMLCLIFVPFYSLYWWYTRGEKVKQSFNEHNYTVTGGGAVYLVLAILGLSIVSMAIMQNDFNSLKSETHSEQRSTSGKALFLNIVLSKLFVTVFCNIGLNSLWLSILYKKAFWVYLSGRIIKNLVMLPIEIVILFAVIQLLIRAGVQKMYK